MALTTRDYKGILELIDLIYTVPDRALMFQEFCERLQKLAPISSAAYAPAEPNSSGFEFPGAIVFRAPMRPLYLFTEYYAALHPYYISVRKEGTTKYLNKATNLTDMVPALRLPDLEYGRDFQPVAQVLYELCTMLGAQGDPVGTMGFHRQRGDRDFSDREKEIFNHLMPHLAQSFHLFGLTQGRFPSPEIGEIILGEDGRPLSINKEARQALNGWSLCAIPDSSRNTGPTFFSTENGIYRARTALKHPGRKERTIFLEPLPAKRDLRSKLADYGLSKRELEVAMWVIRGLSNRQIAERLFIAEQTVKDHLHDVFEKMTIHHRSELAAKLLGFGLKPNR